ncbi:hypothetical protein PS1_019250 [Malus domestica]
MIDVKTSYSFFLERPWIHKNVMSTFHQCLKYYREGVKVIQGNTKPFTKVESYFMDTKFYMDEDTVPEAFPKEIKSTSKAAPKKNEWQDVPKEQEGEVVPFSNKTNDESAKPTTTKRNVTPSKGSNTTVFCYIPMSRRNSGQSPFEISKANTQLHKDNIKLLKINAVLPLT